MECERGKAEGEFNHEFNEWEEEDVEEEDVEEEEEEEELEE